MSKEIRQMIDKVKNFKQFVNENKELHQEGVSVGDVLLYSNGLYWKIIEINNGIATVYDGFKTKGKIEANKLIAGDNLKILKDVDGKEFKNLKQKSKKHIAKNGTDEDYLDY